MMNTIKNTFIYCLTTISLCFCFSGCNSGFNSFEDPSYYTTSPSPVSNVTTESLPGQIKLKWVVPSDSNYYFVKISYFDFLTRTTKATLSTVYSDSVLIDNTRAKYGDYTFNLQTFNSKNEGGSTLSVKASSGPAPIITTYISTKIPLRVSQLSTNAQEQSEGPIANLLDNDATTMFHTDWHGIVPAPHYMDIHLDAPITSFKVAFKNRASSQACAQVLDLLTSNDGITWTPLMTINQGLPSGAGADYTSDIWTSPTPFTYLRWSVAQTYNGSVYWNMAEFAMYSVQVSTYNPEL